MIRGVGGVPQAETGRFRGSRKEGGGGAPRDREHRKLPESRIRQGRIFPMAGTENMALPETHFHIFTQPELHGNVLLLFQVPEFKYFIKASLGN